jgi:uncharacterized SAM-binding protein YcdF (DUF218 family)
MIRLDARHPTVQFALALALVLAVLWAAGFAWFVYAAGLSAPPPPLADGIVALTGGADRIETALRLLAEGRAQRLLVSGVGPTAEFGELARRAGVDPALRDRVTLGRAAVTTRGNASETAEWVRDNTIRTLIVVTATYHMPRALAELSRAVPEVTLYPVPVLPPALRGNHDAATLRLLAGEYSKWLAAEIGLSGLVGREGLLHARPAAAHDRPEAARAG